jgi:hypothetical protein
MKEKLELSILFAKTKVLLIYAMKINLNIYKKLKDFKKIAMQMCK